jgi:manganese peroxidase
MASAFVLPTDEVKPSLVNQPLMALGFKNAMAKLSVVGQDASKLTDCSNVIPAPTKGAPLIAKLPPGKKLSDIQFSVCIVLL